jgi:F-type H+-transporting ATPase subunit delta
MPKEEKKRVLALVFGDDISKQMLSLISLLIDKGRISYLAEIIDEYQRLCMENEGIAQAYITSAKALSEQEESNIKKSLEKALSRQIIMHTEVDTKLIGGLVVRVGDQIFDNSLSTKLQNLKKGLLQKKISQEVVR